jgi:hypothetical protein
MIPPLASSYNLDDFFLFTITILVLFGIPALIALLIVFIVRSDRKPSRIVTIYVPAALGLITGLVMEPMCLCSRAKLVSLRLGTMVLASGVWWLLLIAVFYGYHFVRGLFRGRR